MKKSLRVILSTLSWIVVSVVSIPILLGLLLQIGPIQNMAVGYLTDWLTERSGVEFSIRKVDIGFFNKAIFDGVYVQDPVSRDTMLYVDNLNVSIKGINFFTGHIALGTVSLKDGQIYLTKDSSNMMNVKLVTDCFKAKVPNPDPGDFMLDATELNLINIGFRYKIYKPREQPYGVNFQDLRIRSIHFQARNIEVLNYDVRFSIEHLSFVEKSGFRLQHLNSRHTILNGTGMRFSDLQVETQQSLLRMDHLDFLYDSWYAYNDFVHDVSLDAEIETSTLAYRTISYFTRRPPSTIPTTILFSGTVKGPVCDLQGEITNLKSGYTVLETSFRITGLPNIDSTYFDLQLNNLLTDAQDVEIIYNDLTGKDLGKISPILARCGTMHFSGNFDGLLSEFTADGRLSTRQGAVEGLLKFSSHKSEHEGVQPATRFVGHVATRGFDLGGLLHSSSKIGHLSAEADIDASLGSKHGLVLSTKAQVDGFEYNGYNYNNVHLNGLFQGGAYEGHVVSSDSNLRFNTNGRFDFSSAVPNYDFEMDLEHANLFVLNINRTDSVSVLSSSFGVHATGSTIDDINGSCNIRKLKYYNHQDTVNTNLIEIDAINGELDKSIILKSDFLDAQLRGRNSYSNMFRFLGQSLKRYLPSIPDIEGPPSKSAKVAKAAGSAHRSGSKPSLLRSATSLATDMISRPDEEASVDGYYLLQLDVKQANNVAAIFVPGLEVAQGSKLTFLFNPAFDQFSLSAQSDYILRRDLYIDSLVIESRNQGDSVSIYMGANSVGIGDFDMPDFSILGGIKNNIISLGARFSNPETGYKALLNTTSTLKRSLEGVLQLDIGVHSTNLLIDHQKLYLAPSHIVIDTTGVGFDRFRIWGERQAIDINGRATGLITDTLNIQLTNVDLSPLSQIVARQGYSVKGRLGGSLSFVAPLGNMQFSADMSLDSLGLNEHQFGHLDIGSQWDAEREWVRFYMAQPNGNRPVTGVYDSRNSRYRVDFHFPEFDMRLLEPLMVGIMEDTKGTADAKLTLTGKAAMPTLNGTINVKDYEATVAYTRARYRLAGLVNVKNNRFELPDTPIADMEHGHGTIRAWFDSDYFKRLRYNVHVNFTDLMALNTTIKENPIYHGQVYGTGSFEVGGDEYNTRIDVRAQTALSSRFVLPVSQVSTISEADFITFVKPYQAPVESRISRFHRERQTKANRMGSKSELEVNLALNVLPNTEARIVMNERFGDEIRGRGTGRFRMRIVPTRDLFTMDGQYEVLEGKYLFTVLGAVANKLFTIQPGGIISWRGDPADPQVNLSAVYKVRASLAPLSGVSQNRANSGTVAVNCGIHMTGQLFSPDINLSLTAPSATPETQNLLRNILNTQESTMQQFVYLLAFGGFMPDVNSGSIGTMSGSLAGIAGMEFLSNQISNMISSDKYRLSLGYRPQSEITSEEVTFGLSANIIDNLSVEVGGNYDVNRNAAVNASANPLSVDANLTWVLNKSGSLKVKGFTRTIDRFDESQGLQDNGVGIAYRQEFQNLRDLRARYHSWMERIKQNKIKRDKKQSNNKKKRADQSALGPLSEPEKQ